MGSGFFVSPRSFTDTSPYSEWLYVCYFYIHFPDPVFYLRPPISKKEGTNTRIDQINHIIPTHYLYSYFSIPSSRSSLLGTSHSISLLSPSSAPLSPFTAIFVSINQSLGTDPCCCGFIITVWGKFNRRSVNNLSTTNKTKLSIHSYTLNLPLKMEISSNTNRRE
jgi:hypothetical protein